jgi:hypothetical protein
VPRWRVVVVEHRVRRTVAQLHAVVEQMARSHSVLIVPGCATRTGAWSLVTKRAYPVEALVLKVGIADG